MKQPQQITPVGAKTTFVDVWKCGQELERLHARIAARFARSETHRRALAFLKGIVSSIERKNGWQLAEHAGESRPDCMQRLLNSASWNADLVRDDLRAYILERLRDPGAVLVIDETSVRKRGNKLAGVATQHCGTTGHLENCQVGLFLAYAGSKGHTLLDRKMYLFVGGEPIFQYFMLRSLLAGRSDVVYPVSACWWEYWLVHPLLQKYFAYLPLSLGA